MTMTTTKAITNRDRCEVCNHTRKAHAGPGCTGCYNQQEREQRDLGSCAGYFHEAPDRCLCGHNPNEHEGDNCTAMMRRQGGWNSPMPTVYQCECPVYRKPGRYRDSRLVAV